MIHRDDGFGRRRAIAQCTVGTFCVVVSPPLFDQDLCFAQAVEDFAVEQLVSEPAVEAFTVSVLPRAARFDVGRLGANGGDPVSDSLGDKFRPIVRTYETGHTAKYEQVCQGVDYIGRVQLPLDPDCQAFPTVLIKDVQRPEGFAVVGSTMNEVIRPNMVAILWPYSDRRRCDATSTKRTLINCAAFPTLAYTHRTKRTLATAASIIATRPHLLRDRRIYTCQSPPLRRFATSDRPRASRSNTIRIRRLVCNSRWVTSQIGNSSEGKSGKTFSMPGSASPNVSGCIETP